MGDLDTITNLYEISAEGTISSAEINHNYEVLYNMMLDLTVPVQSNWTDNDSISTNMAYIKNKPALSKFNQMNSDLISYQESFGNAIMTGTVTFANINRLALDESAGFLYGIYNNNAYKVNANDYTVVSTITSSSLLTWGKKIGDYIYFGVSASTNIVKYNIDSGILSTVSLAGMTATTSAPPLDKNNKLYFRSTSNLLRWDVATEAFDGSVAISSLATPIAVDDDYIYVPALTKIIRVNISDMVRSGTITFAGTISTAINTLLYDSGYLYLNNTGTNNIYKADVNSLSVIGTASTAAYPTLFDIDTYNNKLYIPCQTGNEIDSILVDFSAVGTLAIPAGSSAPYQVVYDDTRKCLHASIYTGTPRGFVKYRLFEDYS